MTSRFDENMTDRKINSQTVSRHEHCCIEDLNAIGKSLVELPGPKAKKKKKL